MLTSTATAAHAATGICSPHYSNHRRIVSLTRLSNHNGTLSSGCLLNAQLPLLNQRKSKLTFVPGAADSTQPSSPLVVDNKSSLVTDQEFSLAKVFSSSFCFWLLNACVYI